MRWILGLVTALVMLVAIAALVAPRVIEWDAYRPTVAAAMAERSGLRTAIGGDLHMVLLPAPTLFANDLRLYSPDQPDQERIRVESLRAELDLLPLLLGRVQLREIALHGPTVTLDLDEEPGWAAELMKERLRALRPGATGMDQAAAPAAGAVGQELHDVAVRDGRVLVVRGGEPVVEATGLRLDFEAPRPGQVSRLAMEAGLGGLPVSLVLDVGQPMGGGGAPLRLRAELAGGLALASFGGQLLPLSGEGDGAPVAEGNLTITLRQPGSLLSALGLADGEPDAALQDGLAVTSRVAAGAGWATANDIDLRWGRATLAGAATAAFRPTLDLDIALQAAGLELGGLVRHLPLQAGAAWPAALLAVDARIAFDIAASTLRFHDSLVRDLHLAGVLQDSGLSLREGRAELPGGTRATLQGMASAPGGVTGFSGHLAVEASDLRRTLTWLGVRDEWLPPTRPRRVTAAADLTLDAGLWRLLNLQADLDGTALRGGVALRRTGRPSFSANLRLADLDLDPYLAGAEGGTSPLADVAGLPARLDERLDERLGALGTAIASFDSNLRLRAENIVLAGQPLAEAHLDLSLVRGEMNLSRVEVLAADGMRLEASGHLSAEPGYLAYDLDLSGEAGRLSALLDGLPLPERILRATAGTLPQPLLARMRLTGDTGQAIVRDLHLALPGAELSGTATIGLVGAAPSLVSSLSWRVDEADRLPFEIGEQDLLAVLLPANGSGTFTMDAGSLSVAGLTLALPLLTLTGEGRYGRGSEAADFGLILGAQADSLPALLGGLGMTLDPSPRAMMDRPLTLVLEAGGRGDEVVLRHGRLEMGDVRVQADGGGRLGAEPDFAGELRLEAEQVTHLLEGVGLSLHPADPDLGPVRLTGAYRLGADGILMDILAGDVGPMAVAGGVGLDWSGPLPRLHGDLALRDVPLDRFLPESGADLDALLSSGNGPASPGPAAVAARPAGAAADGLLSRFTRVGTDLRVKADGVGAARGAFTHGTLLLHLSDRMTSIRELDGAFLGGRLSGQANLDWRGQPAVDLEAVATGIEAAAAFRMLGIASGLTGPADVDLRLRTAGDSLKMMLNRLAGQVDLQMSRGRLEGLDLPRLTALVETAVDGSLSRDGPVGHPLFRQREPAESVDRMAERAVTSALLGGETAIRTLSGALFVEGGVLRLEHVLAGLTGGDASYYGHVDLDRGQMDVTGSYRLDLDANPPAIDIRLVGASAEPDRQVQAGALATFVATRITASMPSEPAAAGAERGRLERAPPR